MDRDEPGSGNDTAVHQFLIMSSDVTRFALGWAFVAAGSFVLMLVPGIVWMLFHPQEMSHRLFDERPAVPGVALSAMSSVRAGNGGSMNRQADGLAGTKS